MAPTSSRLADGRRLQEEDPLDVCQCGHLRHKHAHPVEFHYGDRLVVSCCGESWHETPGPCPCPGFALMIAVV